MSGMWASARRVLGFSPERKRERHGNQKRIDETQSRFGLLAAEEQQRRRLGARRAAKVMRQRLGDSG